MLDHREQVAVGVLDSQVEVDRAKDQRLRDQHAFAELGELLRGGYGGRR